MAMATLARGPDASVLRDTVNSLFRLARAAFEEGDPATAARHLGDIVAMDPGNAQGWRVLGDIARHLDDDERARDAWQRALALDPDDAPTLFALAIALTRLRQIDAAIAAFRAGLRIDPSAVDAHTNLALLHGLNGDYDTALGDLARALMIAPDNLRALALAAHMQQRRGCLPQAEALCRRVLARDRAHAPARQVLGRVLFEAGRLDEAVAEQRALLADSPDNAEAWHELGVVLMTKGQIGAAREALTRALRINPDQHATWPVLASVTDFAKAPDLAARVVAAATVLAADPRRLTGPNDPLIPMHFAAGKALDDAGDHAGAFAHYRAGGALVRRHTGFDEARQIALCRDIKARFTAEFMAGHGLAGDSAVAPVFIVGMARSGSTLIEQILGSHPSVLALDEARHLPRAIDACIAADPALAPFPAMVGGLGQAHVDTMARAWRVAAMADRPDHAPDPLRITDKLLTNFYFLGLIAVLFPRARVIQTLRDPVDTCVSAFATLFAADLPHTYELTELGRYYCRYIDLMEHWRAVLPPGMMTVVQYEDVVRDVEREARRLIEFIGLSWDPACLAFHTSARSVRTASVAAVRQPVHARSVNRWRRYGAALDPLIAALAPSSGKPGGL